MVLFSKQMKFIDDLESQMFEVLKNSINTNQTTVQNYVIDKQLYDKGQDGNEKRLKGYTRTTIRYKIAKGQPADRTTLKDKGYFHASVNIDAFDDRFEISSDVGYAKYLIKRYGKSIMKPSLPNMKEFFNKYFIPNLKTKIDGQFTR
jgi:hypothetical protein